MIFTVGLMAADSRNSNAVESAADSRRCTPRTSAALAASVAALSSSSLSPMLQLSGQLAPSFTAASCDFWLLVRTPLSCMAWAAFFALPPASDEECGVLVIVPGGGLLPRFRQR